MSYESIKSLWPKYKPYALIVAGFVFVFFVGLGIGKLEPQNRQKTGSGYSNYSTKSNSKPQNKARENEPTGTVAAATNVSEVNAVAPVVQNKPAEAVPAASDSCLVKGNISSKEKIYHVAGGAFYDRVKPEQCFKSEAEAKAAGFRKSSR